MLVGLAVAGLMAGCGGGPGGPVIDPNSGQIAGEIRIDGPFDATQELSVGLVAGTDFMVEQVVAGKVTAQAGASVFSRAIHYSFTHEFVSTYRVQVFSGTPPAQHVWFESAPVTLGFESTSAKVDGSFNFSGLGPYGSVAGTITLTGNWPASGSVFIGLTPGTQPTQLLRWPVESSAVEGGTLAYSVPDVAYGSYGLGLYSADAQGSIQPLGQAAGNVVIDTAHSEITGADFSADLSS
jgi:hypothetical protein